MCFSLQVDVDLKKLARLFQANIAKTEFEKFFNLRIQNPDKFKRPNENNQIFPNYFCPIIIKIKNKNLILPMRYRIRPQNSTKEIPSKFNVFNARMDSLYKKPTWKKLIGKNHCLIPLYKFYEWVTIDEKKQLITFFPKDNQLLFAPGLFDIWYDETHDFHMHSFAIITTIPTPEVQKMNHDRSPVILIEKYYNSWLNPQSLSPTQILKNSSTIIYQHQFLP